MAKSRRRRTSVVKGVGDDNPPPQKIVLRGMADLEKTLAQRFQERKRQVARLAEANAPLRDKLIGPLGKDRSLGCLDPLATSGHAQVASVESPLDF